jgi:predicted ATPase
MPATSTIDFITVAGFKSIASLDKIALRPVNLLIGANGSGKSNFVGLFTFLNAVREGHLQDYIRRAGGAEQILHFGSKTTSAIEIRLSWGKNVNQYRLKLSPTDDDSLYVSGEQVFFQQSGYSKPWDDSLASKKQGREAGISDPDLTKTPGWVRLRLGSFRVYHVHDTSSTSPMRKTSQVADNAFLRPDGSNLAAFLYLLKSKHRESYKVIRGVIQRVAPFFDDFLLSPDRLNEATIGLAWKHKDSAQYFNASALSDGTLRFIALATLFLQPAALRPAVVVVDEPELGLHPVAITMLASLVKQAGVETQVILSTQSAPLLDHFSPEDVLVADRVDGATSLTRLDAARYTSWLEDYGLGQLWEKNEFGGRPRS